MIAFFLLLGLAFLAGGIAAIVDGLPYLVLERGFTQVIIGTTVAVAGVLLLAMCWLLVELRRVRKSLSMAAPLPARGEIALPERALGAAVPVAVGAAAGATAAAAMVGAEGTSDSPAADAPQPDLFGSLVATRMERDEPVFGGMTAPVLRAPEPQPDEVAARAPEPFPPLIGDEEEGRLAMVELPLPHFQDEGIRDDFPPAAATTANDAEPAPSDAPVSQKETRSEDEEEARAASGLDDLRQSLEDRLRQLDIAASGSEPLRPEPAGIADPLEQAGAWMQRSGDTTASAVPLAQGEPEDAGDTGPEEGRPVSVAFAEEVVIGRVERELDLTRNVEPVAEAPEPASDVEPEPEALAGEAAADGPAQPEASEEGVVGAYQVGDTYFTIYANGSIQAQTPSGDYSFASMEELKLFLASERNRLGV